MAKYNSVEFIKINIFGVQNLTEARLDTDVKKLLRF
jgi:hypothetical protein